MVETPQPDAWRSALRTRLIAVLIVFLTWSAGIEARLVYLQVYRHDDYVAKAERQHMRTITVPALRGDIVDRNDRVLATSADVSTIYAVPTEIDDPKGTARALCHALDDCTPEFAAQLVDRFSRQRPFQYVKRHVSPEEADAVRALKLDGIGFTTESHRFYPNRDLLGAVLGYVGLDNTGLGGIELTYNDRIRGTDGTVVVVTDAKKHAFDRVERPPSAGASIELTIDGVLQHEVERELLAGIEANRADAGVAIVMNPWNGEILAMASEPSFNPNVFGKVPMKLRRNRAVEEIYEPGSTFKTVTASAALDQDVLTPDSLIDCAPGYIDIGRRRVHDTHPHGVMTFTDVLVKSSNVGAIKAGFRIGPDRLEKYVRRFGFGSRLMGELPAESPGIVWSSLSDSALASVSMGYQVSVTPLQMITAVSSIANGGVLMRPHIVRATIADGVRHLEAPEAVRRTISAGTAATLTGIMEGVVDHGTATAARLDGYTIAGKTGTAAKLEDGQYSKRDYMASFVGFLPSRKPVVTILVVIDTPRTGTYYGGSVSGPVFKRIAEVAIRHLGIPRTIDPEAPVIIPPPSSASAPRPVTFVAVQPRSDVPARDGVMPDVRGLSARAAVRILARVGLVPHLKGNGFVADQHPEAGAPLDDGTRVDLALDREPPDPDGEPARP